MKLKIQNVLPVNIYLFVWVYQWKSCPITFIEGFEFEQGYLFTLKVRIVHLANPPQDSYDVRYILVSLVSKTKVELWKIHFYFYFFYVCLVVNATLYSQLVSSIQVRIHSLSKLRLIKVTNRIGCVKLTDTSYFMLLCAFFSYN